MQPPPLTAPMGMSSTDTSRIYAAGRPGRCGEDKEQELQAETGHPLSF